MSRNSIWNKILIILCLQSFFVPPFWGMRPIVEKRRVTKNFSQKIVKKPKKKPVSAKKKPVQKLVTKKTIEVPIDMTLLKKLESQIMNTRFERQKLEVYQKGLLEAFSKRHIAFASILPASNETKHQQSIFLALSSKSREDFVHGAVMLNYLNTYRMRRNQEYINLVQNIHRTNFSIQSCYKTEQNLIEQWRAEKGRIDSLLQKRKKMA